MNRYFYIDGEGKQKGTFSAEDLRNEGIRRDTLVWTQGMSEWTAAAAVPELESLFAIAPPDAAARQEEYSAQSSATTPPTHTDIGARQNQPMPKTYMTEAILATILPFILCGNIFCLLGIIGIVNASKVESLYMRGLYAEARIASNEARKWSRIALWIAIGGVILICLLVVLFAFGMGAWGFSL